MMCVRGEYILMLDADGATNFEDLETVLNKMKSIERDGLGIVTGSRNQVVSPEIKRKFHRKILGFVSNFIVSTICGVKLKVDDLCWVTLCYVGHTMRIQAVHKQEC
jgi:dolichyl-phosphate beta-glucosyltransferase